MGTFELSTNEHFHIVSHPDAEHSLMINRLDGCLTVIDHDEAKTISNLKKFGYFYGVVGIFLKKYLVLIKNRSIVGKLFEPSTKTEHEVFVINQVHVVDIHCPSTSETMKMGSVRYNISSSEEFKTDDTNSTENLSSSPSDNDEFSSLPIRISTGPSTTVQSRNNWNPFKLAHTFKPMMPSQFLKSSGLDSDSGCSAAIGGQSTDETDRRLVEEMIKLFNNTDSFYFSWTIDLTNRLSRQASIKTSNDIPIWRTADERFFWNKHMLKDLIEISCASDQVNPFICVIMQGFIAIKNHTISAGSLNEESGVENGRLATSVNAMSLSRGNNSCDIPSRIDPNSMNDQTRTKNYQIVLISRRSVFQAGTRYRRRGCDERGNCANFVETEQVFRYNQHVLSFLIIRGSIPLYWYQTGFNYRPPPVLYRTEQENFDVFTKHFTHLMDNYKTDHIIVVDCTEQSGREQTIHNAYKRNIEKLNLTKPNIELIEFDFHKHCRGRHCNQALIEKHLRSCGITDKMLNQVKYYWNDGDLVWNQAGVMRVNCLDCTDRTNVVQCAIALQVLDIQLARLGVIAPDTCPEDNECREIMRGLWSMNGNVLSTQYCGTKALFTGDRKLSGYIKDTYSSASRYYISKFRDASRQAAIDAMLGIEGPIKEHTDSESREQVTTSDQYELMTLDPMLTGRGGALLKDMGNKVSSRIARLRGKFGPRPPFEFHSTNISEREACAISGVTNPNIEARFNQTLEGLNIDWPSTESMEMNDKKVVNLFAQMSNSDDSFQDDEFGSLVLSIDMSDLQKMRGEDEELKKANEEIHMTETGGLRSDSIRKAQDISTSTTST